MWLHPRILASMPAKLKEAVMQEKSMGLNIPVAGVLLRLLTWMQPGGWKSMIHYTGHCRALPRAIQPHAALEELRRWFKAIQRAIDIKMQLPSMEQLYRGARSIYSGAFEREDFALRLRWTQEEQQWGYPHPLSYQGLQPSTRLRKTSSQP